MSLFSARRKGLLQILWTLHEFRRWQLYTSQITVAAANWDPRKNLQFGAALPTAAHCWCWWRQLASGGSLAETDEDGGKRGEILAPDPRSPPTLQGHMVDVDTGNLVLWLPPHFPVQCLVHCFFPSMDHLSPVPWLCSVLWHPHRQVIIVLCDCDLFLLTLFTPHPLNQWHWWPHPIPLNYNVAPVPIEEPLTLSGVGWCNIYTCACVSHYSADNLTRLTVKLIHMLKFNEINFKL